MGSWRCSDRRTRPSQAVSKMKDFVKAQSTLEYALFIAVVAAALAAMNTYIRRSIQANLKVVEDRVNAEALKP